MNKNYLRTGYVLDIRTKFTDISTQGESDAEGTPATMNLYRHCYTRKALLEAVQEFIEELPEDWP
jgi:hypothetical protein